MMTVLYYRLTSKPQLVGERVGWKEGSEGLVVFLHGLRNDPAAWFSQKALLRGHPKIDVFAPVVPKRGMCSLEEAARPILPTLLDYTSKNPRKPVCLLGVSNGSRIATWLEVQLRGQARHTPVKVSTIAGVHLGSSRMNLLEKLGLSKWFYPEALRSELKYKSSYAESLLRQVQAPLPAGCAPRAYEFYATTDDLSVPDLDSSLPHLGKGEQHHVVHGHSHDSIVTAVARQQMMSCTTWIRGRG